MSLVRRRLFSSCRPARLSKGPRRKAAAAAPSALRVERLEDRRVLSSVPMLTSVGQDDDPALEGSQVTVSVGFEDDVETGGNGFGIDPADPSHADYINDAHTALVDILVNTTDQTWSVGGLDQGLMSTIVDSGGVDVLAFVFDSFMLGTGVTLKAIGDKPLAILSLGDMTINGTIDVSPLELVPGGVFDAQNSWAPGAGGGEGGNATDTPGGSRVGQPGAGAPTDDPLYVTGGGARTSNVGGSSGGGGGGHFGAGGEGTRPISPRPAGGKRFHNLFDADGNYIAFDSLTAGSGGGAGSSSLIPEGGDGGGGIELGAIGTIIVGMDGEIIADGGFGEHDPGNNGSGGGGAGGTILIHGFDVTINGVVSANGGNGGQTTQRGGGGSGGRITIADDEGGVNQLGPVISDINDITAIEGNASPFSNSGEAGNVTLMSYTAGALEEQYEYVIDFGTGFSAPILVTGVTPGEPGGVNEGAFSFDHTFLDGDVSGTQQVTVRIGNAGANFATGADGADFSEFEIDVNVANVAPMLTVEGDASVDEGSLYALDFSALDPGQDTITEWLIDWGDGSTPDIVAGALSSATHIYADGANSYVIQVTATDEDGTYAASPVVVAVNNVAPELMISGAATGVEGSPYTLNLASSDPGVDTIAGWTIDWGDGIIETVTGNPTNVTHTFADGSMSYTISAMASDEDDSYDANALVVAIANLAPVVAISGAGSVDEGDEYVLILSESDPGDDAIFQWEINWGDGDIETITGNPASVSHVYADGTATSNYTILATATDEDGTFTANSLAVSVLNVDPTADAGGPYVTFDDLAITLTGTGSDVAGAADPLSYAWDLDGDNVFETTGATVSFDPEALGIDGTQVWTVQFKVTDGDGGEAIDTDTIQIYGKGTYLIDGILYVIGDKVASDIALITQCDGDISVLATFNDNNPAVFAAADVTKIVARTRGGHDVCVTTSSVTEEMTIEGGSGNDLLVGGCGENFIYGGAGHDTLYGGCGNDMLFGGDGDDDLFGRSGTDVLVGEAGNDIMDGGADRDLLIGGLNEDWIHGGAEDDILIGGYTSHDNDLAALDAIMAIWTSSASFADRVATLTGPSGYLVPEVTVFDDGATDHIIGAAGRDLAFGDTSKWDGVKDTISLSSAQDTLIALN